MSIDCKHTYEVDLARGVQVTPLGQMLFTGDKNGDTFRIRVLEGGAAADIGGSAVNAYVIRADNATVPLTGEVRDGVAVVTLDAACYAVPGRVMIVIKLGRSGALHAIFAGEGAVVRSSTDMVVDQTGVIPSLEEILAQITLMEQATEDANKAAMEATAARDDIIERLESGELTGKGLQILGYYGSLSALQADVQTPAAGDAYAVGTAAPYDTYIWDAVGAAWVNNGTLQGVPGEPGAKGDKGERGPAGVSAADNLLDNSDFRIVINQRGKASYTGSGYTIDRWRTWNSAYSVQVSTGWIAVTGAIQQNVENADANEIYTLAACDTSGTVHILSGRPAASPTGDKIFLNVGSNGYVGAGLKDGMWLWAALYKGEYTADNLPGYIRKGRGAELAECQRYFWLCDNTYFTEGAGYAFDASTFRAAIVLPQEMRAAPVMTAENGNTVHYGIKVCTGGSALTPTAVSMQLKRNRACLTLTGTYTQGAVGVLRLESALSFSADL